MNSILMDMQPWAAAYVDVLSKILKVEVFIADEDLQQVAGTGRVFRKEARRRQNGGLLSCAIESGQVQVFQAPGVGPACKSCSQTGHCQANDQMSAPIAVNGQVKGVLVFMASNQTEKDRMLKKRDLYLDFLVQCADFLSLKLQEHRVKRREYAHLELIKLILDYGEAGVLVFDSQGQLIQMNRVSSQLIPVEALPAQAKLTVVEQGNEVSRFLLAVEGRKYRLTGKLRRVSSDEDFHIFIFSNGMKAEPEGDFGQENRGIQRIWGDSQASIKIRRKILEYAGSKAIVLLTGNPGTEKKEVALALHEQGQDSARPFIAVNCRAFSEEVLEKELVGVTMGAAKKGRQGKFEQAAGGTLLLEEIDGLSLSMQAKLLRILEDGAITRIGGTKPSKIHVRMIVTAANDLKAMMEKGEFLETLFYRVFILPIHIPPLCERRDDICSIGKRFLNQEAKKTGKAIVDIDPAFWDDMEQYSWPGNVWQLKGAMEYVINAMGSDGIIGTEHVPDNIRAYSRKVCRPSVREPETVQEFNLKRLEEAAIKKALELFGTDSAGKQMAADKLGIGIATLYRKMKQYHLQ